MVRAKTISSYVQSWFHWFSFRVIISGPEITIDLQEGEEKSTTLFSSVEESEVEYASSRDRADMLLTIFGGLVIIPHSVAMACAVRAKSPVTYKC